MAKKRIKEVSELMSKYLDVFEINQRKRSGHLCITIQHSGKSRKIFTPSTPSDQRSLKNLESDLKKIMKDMENA